MLMEGNLPVNFCAMVPGQVGVFFFVRNGTGLSITNFDLSF